MFEVFVYQHPYLTLPLIAFLVNLPLGYIRESSPKFSLLWFFWIHASIPLIIYLRLILGTSKLFIPISILFAIIGQIIGSHLKLKRMSQKEEEKLQQIQGLKLNKKNYIDAKDVTVVLLNMGGPRENKDIKDFQMRLFSDRKLIRLPLGFLFQNIFAKLLSTLRLPAIQKRYQIIGGASPIFESTYRQTETLKIELNKRGLDIQTTFSFNYSDPLPEKIIKEVQKLKKKYIFPLSLYPHYSSATTGSSIYHLKKAAQKIYPQTQFLEPPAYYLHNGYIQAFVDRINEAFTSDESLSDFYLIFSAHSLPLYCLKEGDPYPFQVAQTISKVLTKLNRSENWITAYQSAVGPLQWIKPDIKDVLKALAKRRIKKVLVIPISFVTDHIETSCEIDIENRKLAENSGIKDYRMSKAIECHPGFIQALADSVEDSCLFSPNTMSLSS